MLNNQSWLVVLTILKNISQLGRIIPYMKWKIKAMFETTNQKGYIAGWSHMPIPSHHF
jgi:hypothetical protein